MPRKESTTGPISAQAQQDQVSEGIENFELPRSIVTRIAKSAIPESTKLQKEAVLALLKGSTVFINYLAATAHDVAHSKQHKSISASDVLKALEIVELGDMVEGLQGELQVYRENAKADKSRKGPSTAPVSHSASTSVAKKVKGKAGEKDKVEGSAILAASFASAVPAESVSAAPIGYFEDDEPVDDAGKEAEDPLDDDMDEEEDAVDGDEDDVGEEEGEEGVTENVMAIEEEEAFLRTDAHALEGPPRSDVLEDMED